MMKPSAVTQYTSPVDGYRYYYDADERIVDISRRCKTCGVWWKDEAHIPPCSSEQNQADTMERISINIAKIGGMGKK